jgi:hypothetical protein
MVRRLKRFGVELDDQSINQDAAQAAYHLGLSTLDLSAASDTIASELVYHLLPIDWALFLDSLRSPETEVDGQWLRTEKFASMGNAFCFGLETIIFWAISRSVVDELAAEMPVGSVNSVVVYGDDIIVPQWSADLVISCLEVCGFTVNKKKSHLLGNFYESCGKHFHMGVDVTPVYQKELIRHPSEIIRAHNRLQRLSKRLPVGFDFTRKARKGLANSYPLRPFPRVPEGIQDDGGFLRPLEEFALDRNHGFRCHVLDYVPKLNSAHEGALYAYKLRQFSRHSRPHNAEFLGDHSSNNPTNAGKRGHAGIAAKGTWRTRVRWVPYVSLLNCSEARADAN